MQKYLEVCSDRLDSRISLVNLDIGSVFACGVGTCAYYSSSGTAAQGCCSGLSTCVMPTTCYDYAQYTASSCGLSCQNNSANLVCSRSFAGKCQTYYSTYGSIARLFFSNKLQSLPKVLQAMDAILTLNPPERLFTPPSSLHHLHRRLCLLLFLPPSSLRRGLLCLLAPLLPLHLLDRLSPTSLALLLPHDRLVARHTMDTIMIITHLSDLEP